MTTERQKRAEALAKAFYDSIDEWQEALPSHKGDFQRSLPVAIPDNADGTMHHLDGAFIPQTLLYGNFNLVGLMYAALKKVENEK
jgi:hypothetical protein